MGVCLQPTIARSTRKLHRRKANLNSFQFCAKVVQFRMRIRITRITSLVLQ